MLDGTASFSDTRVDADGSAPRGKRGLGLAGRVLLLIAGFVMVAEIMVFVPLTANFRTNWLRARVSAAYTAALVFEAAPREVPEPLAKTVLDSVGAKTIVLKYADTRRLLAASAVPLAIDESYDLRTATMWDAIGGAGATLLSGRGRVLRVVADAPMGGEYMEITLDESPLRAAIFDYGRRILLISLAISIFVAVLAALAIHAMILRPVRRLTSSILEFGADPENASRIIKPSKSRHEIGRAEEALAVMQHVLLRELSQKNHLAALGLAVAKINHDLRNMLSTAQLLSDRLADGSDPMTRRIGPQLVATLDRAIGFCQSTLTYGRAAERPPRIEPVDLSALVSEVFATLAPGLPTYIHLENGVPVACVVDVDPEQLFRVLLNLVRNAVEALGSAGPQPGHRAEVSIGATFQRDGLLLEVRDTGPGVPASVRAHLFEAFKGSGRTGGTGLGLAIAADLVRAHGGRIELVERGVGSTFRIFLPRPPAER